MKFPTFLWLGGGLSVVVSVLLLTTMWGRSSAKLFSQPIYVSNDAPKVDEHEHDHEHSHAAGEAHIDSVMVTPAARKNLGLFVKQLQPETYWKRLHVPGVVTDRPGCSDRGITSPAVGTVAQVHAFPGDIVKPGDKLFTLRLFSEYLQNTQAELFKASRELQLIAEQKSRIESGVQSGAISSSRIIELEAQAKRQATLVQSFRQDLLTRGLEPNQIDLVADGKFVSTIDVVVPSQASSMTELATSNPLLGLPHAKEDVSDFEVQELRVELGQQVQAGQLLSVLANHQHLYIEGAAFKREASLLARAAEEDWPVEAQFAEEGSSFWPTDSHAFSIRHLSSVIDSDSRVLTFFVPLENQSRSYVKDHKSFTVWRYRPGQRVRLAIPIEKMEDVFVFPSSGIARDGAEAFVFYQNGDIFYRISVHILHQDHSNAVVANDGSIFPGLHFAQNSSAALNRIFKSQSANPSQANFHVHADGSVHAH